MLGRHFASLEVRLVVILVKIRPAVPTPRDRAEKGARAEDGPREIELMREKARASARRVKVVVIVPFAGDVPRP